MAHDSPCRGINSAKHSIWVKPVKINKVFAIGYQQEIKVRLGHHLLRLCDPVSAGVSHD